MPTLGHLLPVCEVILGACLVLGVMTRVSGVLAALLFVAPPGPDSDSARSIAARHGGSLTGLSEGTPDSGDSE